MIRGSIVRLCTDLHVLGTSESIGVGPAAVVDQLAIEEDIGLAVSSDHMSHVVPSVQRDGRFAFRMGTTLIAADANAVL